MVRRVKLRSNSLVLSEVVRDEELRAYGVLLGNLELTVIRLSAL